MEELCKKYPALVLSGMCVTFYAKELVKNPTSPLLKHLFYGSFKANISCIGLEPEEYETVIKWFCDIMEY